MGTKKTKIKNEEHDVFYGTKSEWIVKDLNTGEYICNDGKGEYVTEKKWIDSGLLDPNRMYR